MVSIEISRDHAAGALLAKPVVLIAFALAVAHAVFLASFWVDGLWADRTGAPSDFVAVWAAGKLASAGHPAAVYDWGAHKLVEQTAVGHPFAGYFGFHYPPTFLLVAAALSMLSYATAYTVWALGTFPAYLIAIRAIVGDRIGYLLAAAFPAVLANFTIGQNGFVTAGLIGGTLVLMRQRPIMAAVLLGLLTFKPHLGLLFPIALIAGREWRVLVTATIVALAMAGASWLAFGADTWQAFVGNIGHTSQAFLSEGSADWRKLQTIFGLTRSLGGSEPLAWSLQAMVTLAAATAVAALWRSTVQYEVKAAALGTGLMLATPYLYTYDLVALAVPLAFLFRLGLTRGFLPQELIGIGLACLLVLIFPFVDAPTGFAALLVVAALIARRALTGASIAHAEAPIRPVG
ncbi:MAG TPA: glycosyltransferase family 87 protein [Xanthobacteraceae bacterium]|nr:glycosyltransferase family 87 protein [Xanthobacteraceae bacterium]